MKRNVMILTSAMALLLLVSIAFAQGGYDLSRWTVDGGGYTFSEGGGCSLGGTVGQADAGVLMGNDYTLVGGFWGGDVATGLEIRFVYLPLVLKNFCRHVSCDPYECNDNRHTAWGPLASGQTIDDAQICPGDPRDIYYFDASGPVQVTIDLTNIPGNADFDLYLWDETGSEPLDESEHGAGQNEKIVYTLPPGEGSYYVDVYPRYGTGPYTLQGSGW